MLQFTCNIINPPLFQRFMCRAAKGGKEFLGLNQLYTFAILLALPVHGARLAFEWLILISISACEKFTIAGNNISSCFDRTTGNWKGTFVLKPGVRPFGKCLSLIGVSEAPLRFNRPDLHSIQSMRFGVANAWLGADDKSVRWFNVLSFIRSRLNLQTV